MAAAFAFAHVNVVRELCMWPKAQFGPKHWTNENSTKSSGALQQPEEFVRWAQGVCVTSIWEIENVGNSWKKSSAVLQILRGKSQPTPDVEMVDFEHMKCCGFNSCSQSAFLKLFGSYQGRNTFSLLKRDESWEQLGCTANNVCQTAKRRVLFINFIFNGMRQEFSHSENTNFPTSDQYAPDKIEINSYHGLSTYEIVKSSTFESFSFRIKQNTCGY